MPQDHDLIIIGAGIVGLTVGLTLKKAQPNARVLILDKEPDTAYHASGRNSGVLHAGFYYTSDSLKAKFTIEGNRSMKAYCRNKGIPVNECGKLVVTRNESELPQLEELNRRGKLNGSQVSLIDEEEARRIEPNIRTFRKALFSPHTASVDPRRVCQAIKTDLQNAGVEFLFGTKYLSRSGNTIRTTQGELTGRKIINCAGLYADKVAHDFGFGNDYTMMPFKGLYLKYTKNTTDIKVNIYPVPNLKNPFLGVHFTKTADGHIKIGPTAIPAFWREDYDGFQNFSLSEFAGTAYHAAQLFLLDSFHFRSLALEEIRKFDRSYLIREAAQLVRSIDPEGFTEPTPPGIRAQLLNVRTRTLVQDFVIEGDKNSVHVLNAVSPAFTCAFPFAESIVQKYLLG